jgi:tRNA pseudouridine32 synthase/23S rRNA pseudouridine746 synthase
MELFQTFKTNITTIPLPEKFTFPFYYEPHPLSVIAAKALQNYLETQNDFQHNFGLNDIQQGLVIGKMFGVLVVQNQNNELGFLWAFSGKLAESNQHPFFVPTVFDMLTADSFFKKEETLLNQYNREIELLENNPDYLYAIKQLEQTKL